MFAIIFNNYNTIIPSWPWMLCHIMQSLFFSFHACHFDQYTLNNKKKRSKSVKPHQRYVFSHSQSSSSFLFFFLPHHRHLSHLYPSLRLLCSGVVCTCMRVRAIFRPVWLTSREWPTMSLENNHRRAFAWHWPRKLNCPWNEIDVALVYNTYFHIRVSDERRKADRQIIACPILLLGIYTACHLFLFLVTMIVLLVARVFWI